jgi:hypothetical protein
MPRLQIRNALLSNASQIANYRSCKLDQWRIFEKNSLTYILISCSVWGTKGGSFREGSDSVIINLATIYRRKQKLTTLTRYLSARLAPCFQSVLPHVEQLNEVHSWTVRLLGYGIIQCQAAFRNRTHTAISSKGFIQKTVREMKTIGTLEAQHGDGFP